MSKQNIAIIGGGPASLMLACSLDTSKFNISIYEKRIEEHRFKNSIEKEVYKNGYRGFLIWITNKEYPEYDQEYKKNITEE